MTAEVFAKLAPYGYVHHRALNNFAALEEAENNVSAYPNMHQVLEGDICWDFSAGRAEFYFRHPSFIVDTLSLQRIDMLKEQRALVTLDDVLARDTARKTYVIELKVGRGETRAALNTLVGRLQEACRGRFWIDGFSLPLVRLVKQIDAGVATSLHTEFVTARHIVRDAPEWPPLAIDKLDRLRGVVDAISIRKRFSDHHMARACAAVRERGFTLLMSRLFTIEDYALSRKWGAVVGYPKAPFEAIAAYDREHPAPLAKMAHS